MIGVHVRSPRALAPLVEFFFDPVPYAGEGLAIPDIDVPVGMPLYWNGDYSRFGEWVDWLIKKHQEGHPVWLLIPMGDNEEMRTLAEIWIPPTKP